VRYLENILMEVKACQLVRPISSAKVGCVRDCGVGTGSYLARGCGSSFKVTKTQSVTKFVPWSDFSGRLIALSAWLGKVGRDTKIRRRSVDSLRTAH